MSSNRPFTRSLIKIGVRLALGRGRAHVQDWFPGLRLETATPLRDGAIWYRGKSVGRLVASASAFPKDLSTVLIVGSGPSVSGIDFTRTRDASHVLLNGALHLVPGMIAAPLAVVIEDERFVWAHFDLVRQAPAGCRYLLSVSVIRAICELDRTWFQNRTIILIDDLRKPYGQERRGSDDLRLMPSVLLSEDGATGFSTDPDLGVFQAGSVVVSALQFALSWRPGAIGLLGIDISNADQPRFYEASGKVYSGVRRAQDRIIDHLVLAKSVAAESGIVVANHSPVSALLKHGFGYSDAFAKLPGH